MFRIYLCFLPQPPSNPLLSIVFCLVPSLTNSLHPSLTCMSSLPPSFPPSLPPSLPLPQVFTWGCNDEGALGRVTEEGDEFNPKVVEKLEGIKVVQVAAGDSHTVALADNGIIYCWGVFRVSGCGLILLSNTL